MITYLCVYVCVCPHPHCSFEGAGQYMVYGQLGVVAPYLGGAHPLSGRDKETVLSPASCSGRQLLVGERRGHVTD